MREFLIRTSAVGLAAALSGMIACSSSTSGCGSSATANPVTGSSTQPTSMLCGPGTQAVTTSNNVTTCQATTSH